MAGLYPEDQDINVFGEIIKFPSMGTDGKFTNGDFTDPKKPASFIPAETMNLIIDNLNNLIKYCGLEPNNTSSTQLKEALNNKIYNLKAENIFYDDTNTNLNANNVQELGEKLAHRIDTIENNLNIIADGAEHDTGRLYDGKPLYYRAYKRYNLSKGTHILEKGLGKIIDSIYTMFMVEHGKENYCTVQNYHSEYSSSSWGSQVKIEVENTYDLEIYLDRSTRLATATIFYTKLSDSRKI